MRKAPTAGGIKLWEPGEVILGLYEVRGVHRAGGMSLVYRVHHRQWDIDLALKIPRRQLARSEQHKRLFEREAETWVGLGPHPNVASCYYVRRIDEVPGIFAEYVEGGSLADWIGDRRLYAGGPGRALERLLDVAIQTARGLHHAHQQGLVHQDVKPGNVLLTAAGVAKVTDFGLARARAVAAAPGAPSGPLPARRTTRVSSGGLTPVYCSPEQLRRRPLSIKTDIWSWAVSVLEMFLGQVTWRVGARAGEAFEGYPASGPPGPGLPRMPPGVSAVLRQSFQKEPGARPGSMLEVAECLQHAYQEVTGRAYPRRPPRPADALAPGLNNRAISMLDLGKREEAEKLWREAIAVQPLHPESTYNLGLLRWRARQISEAELVAQLRQVCASHAGEWLPLSLLAQAQLETGDYESARDALGAIAEADRDVPEVRALSAEVADRIRNGIRPARSLGGYGGHTKGVLAVALSGDGRLGLSGGWDRTLRLWDLATGRCEGTIEGHQGAVTAVRLSPDGRRALSGSTDRTLRLWDLSAGRCLQTFTGHRGGVNAIAPTADWLYALTGGEDGTLKLWELASGRCLRTLAGDGAPVQSAALDRTGRLARRRRRAGPASPGAARHPGLGRRGRPPPADPGGA
jgi:serine/threonine protein kinase